MSAISNVAASITPFAALNSGASTISAAAQQLNQDAQQMANPDRNSTDALLDSSQTLLQAEAGAAVVRSSNELLGSLFDAFA